MAQSPMINSMLMRFVSGDMDRFRTEDHKKRPIPPDKQGTEFGLAVAKDNPALPAMFQAICAHLWTECAQQPAILQKIQTVMQYFPLYVTSHAPNCMDGFSWKMSDGDKPNQEGVVSEHTRGCWVFYFKSKFPIGFGNAQNAEIPVSAIKRGDYVDIAFQCAWNGLVGADDAGVYLNPKVVRLQFEGDPIGGGQVSVSQAFAAQPQPQYQMPTGAKVPGALPVTAANPMAMPGGAPIQQQPGFPAGNATFPSHAAGPIPSGLPAPTATPALPSPSNPTPGFPGAPANPAPLPGAPAAFPGGNAPLPTGFPGSVQPHPTFAQGPGYPGT
ncbi:hypothetical protein G6M87_10875 [Rhizobium rhizogenes]|uniref:hypothetical protein n=1 Tax=Rhizobium rhizogenes TaxID=359 RepID=UPI001573A832|nr:hypothetical protein [Rhizobium rhizogenes]NTI22360.1 hypothetical protein [Rhizobium rhizogenes]QTG05947.1 hypothetical protein G6M87_10875 [Rhizobium rhizogenes]